MRVNIVMEFDNIETIKQAIIIDAGVSILPRHTVQKEAGVRTLAAVRSACPISCGRWASFTAARSR